MCFSCIHLLLRLLFIEVGYDIWVLCPFRLKAFLIIIRLFYPFFFSELFDLILFSIFLFLNVIIIDGIVFLHATHQSK